MLKGTLLPVPKRMGVVALWARTRVLTASSRVGYKQPYTDFES